jgi:hypothetical protein|tara:strand:+ start:2274 stop:2444 length:171 start_codon:yes stop_codon:yes gene_type:complete
MPSKTYTIAERPTGSNKAFEPIADLPLMSLPQARAALEAATLKGQAEFVIVNTAAI